MKNTFFIADLHLGHAGILLYEPEHRPFKTVEEMNERIITNWNSVVGHTDTVYVLGDVCFGKHNLVLLGLLKGIKRLVLGNHDAYPMHLYSQYFQRIYGATFWKDCLLTHVPVHPSCLGARAFLNVCGHLHSRQVMRPDAFGNPVPDENYMVVSLEQNDLTPIHADVILDRVKELKE